MVVDMIKKVIGNYIDGCWVGSFFGQFSERINPINNNDIVGRVTLSTREDVAQGVIAAYKALVGWSAHPHSLRREYIKKVAMVLRERMDEILVTMARETGKSVKDCWEEIARGISLLEASIWEETSESNPKVTALLHSRHHSLDELLKEIAYELHSGNTIIIKPSLEKTVTVARIMDCFGSAQLPDGVVNMVSGLDAIVENALYQHKNINVKEIPAF